MKETGMSHVVDNFGRVVIPKQLRKDFRIQAGDYMEFFTQGETICLRKENIPMTIGELMKMDGEPVWIIENGAGHWELSADAKDYIEGRSLIDYCKTWEAYSRKPVNGKADDVDD